MSLTTPLNQAAEGIRQKAPDFLARLDALNDDMDRRYAAAAAHYGLVCQGCTQSCCLTRFYHHTLLEYIALWEGVRRLSDRTRAALHARAVTYRRALEASDRLEGPFRHPCPLEKEGRCRLYTQRPMICRLHGVPHTLHHPAKGLITGPGCHACHSSTQPERPLARTPIYTALAGLERSARAAVGFNQPLRLTIADMILAMPSCSRSASSTTVEDQRVGFPSVLQTKRRTG